MNYNREWRDLNNAVAFAARCANLALAFYRGDHIHELRRMVGRVFSYVESGRVDPVTLEEVRRRVLETARRATTERDSDVAGCVAKAAKAAHQVMTKRELWIAAVSTSDAAHYANRAGVSLRSICREYVRWVARDLEIDPLEGDDLDAAVAAVIAGEFELITEIGNGLRV